HGAVELPRSAATRLRFGLANRLTGEDATGRIGERLQSAGPLNQRTQLLATHNAVAARALDLAANLDRPDLILRDERVDPDHRPRRDTDGSGLDDLQIVQLALDLHLVAFRIEDEAGDLHGAEVGKRRQAASRGEDPVEGQFAHDRIPARYDDLAHQLDRGIHEQPRENARRQHAVLPGCQAVAWAASRHAG